MKALYVSLSFSEHHDSPVGPTDTIECSGDGFLLPAYLRSPSPTSVCPGASANNIYKMRADWYVLAGSALILKGAQICTNTNNQLFGVGGLILRVFSCTSDNSCDPIGLIDAWACVTDCVWERGCVRWLILYSLCSISDENPESDRAPLTPVPSLPRRRGTEAVRY